MYVTHDSREPPSVVIRRAEPNDATEIRRIASICGIDAWTTGQYLEESNRNDAVIFVAIEGPAIVGFISGRIVPSTSEGFDGEIYNIAVLPGATGRGIGSKLLKSAVDNFVVKHCRMVWLEVRESNHKAIQFYERNGFTPVTIRRDFYSMPVENAVVMRLTLVSTTSVNSSPIA